MNWYVFDKHDCIDCFTTAESAAILAAEMAADGMEGVHIAYMTQAQFSAYYQVNDLNKAWEAT